MKRRKSFAVYLLLAFTAVCFISAPVFADHPWEIDNGDGQNNDDAGDPDYDDKGASIISSGLKSLEGNGWNPFIWFSGGLLILDSPFHYSSIVRQGSQKDRTDVRRSSKWFSEKLFR
jgi:hypothetical protein